MAIFKSPLKGALTGQIGNLITYMVKDQNRVRSRPLVYHDANTPEQQKARKRLTTIVRFYGRLKETPIIEIWRVAAIHTSWDRYGLFRKVNMNVFLPNGKIGDLSKLRLAQGELPQALHMQMEIDKDDHVTLTWTNHLEHTSCRDKDLLGIIALYDNRLFSPVLLENIEATRKDEKAVFQVERKKGVPLHLYCFWCSPEGDAYSNDEYFKVTFN